MNCISQQQQHKNETEMKHHLANHIKSLFQKDVPNVQNFVGQKGCKKSTRMTRKFMKCSKFLTSALDTSSWKTAK